MDETTRLRLRSFVSSWLTVVLVVAIAVAGVGAWATYTAHVDPGSTTEQRSTTVWSATTQFDHSATVTRENPLYPTGTVLSNRSTYFTRLAPVLDGTVTVRPRGLSENVSVDLSTRLVVRAADEERTYWSDTQPLTDVSVQDAGSDPVSVDFSLNVSAVEARIAQIQDAVGATPGQTTAAVVVDAQIAGSTGDAQSQTSFSRRLTLGIAGGTYSISGPQQSTEAVQRTQTVTVPREYGPTRSIGGPVALLLGLGALAAVAYAARDDRIALDDDERARLAYLDDRAEFDEWIVSVRLPSDETDRPVAVADSLADLVDLAVDANTSVIEDQSGDRFHVITSEMRYTYAAPGRSVVTDRADRSATGDQPTLFESPDVVSNAHDDEEDTDGTPEADGAVADHADAGSTASGASAHADEGDDPER